MERRSAFDELIEGFVSADHPEIAAGAFLHRLETLLQIVDLGHEAVVARLEPRVLFALRRDLGLQSVYARHAAIADPELELQHGECGQENGDNGLHGPFQSLATRQLFPIGIDRGHLAIPSGRWLAIR